MVQIAHNYRQCDRDQSIATHIIERQQWRISGVIEAAETALRPKPTTAPCGGNVWDRDGGVFAVFLA
jgi:hypothetical protein